MEVLSSCRGDNLGNVSCARPSVHPSEPDSAACGGEMDWSLVHSLVTNGLVEGVEELLGRLGSEVGL